MGTADCWCFLYPYLTHDNTRQVSNQPITAPAAAAAVAVAVAVAVEAAAAASTEPGRESSMDELTASTTDETKVSSWSVLQPLFYALFRARRARVLKARHICSE